MPPKYQLSKKQKSHHYVRDRNRSSLQDSRTSVTTDNEIPGFYFDPIKNKYFKIQQNTFGIQNIPTSEVIKKKLDKQEFENECKKQLKKRNSLLSLMIKKEIYGANNQLKLDFTNNLIANSILKSLSSFETNLTIKKIEVLSSDHLLNKKNMIFILVNFVGVPFVYKIFELCTDFFGNNENLSNNQLLNQLNFIEQSENGVITGPIEEKISILPAYMVSKNHILSTFKSNDHGDNRPFKLKISQITSYDRESEFLEEVPKYFKSFKFPLWCSDVNKEMTRCAAGLHQGGEVKNLQDNQFFRLNTYRSDVYCVKFKPESEQVFAGLRKLIFFQNRYFKFFKGCKNKFLFGYDLRLQVNNPILEIEHQSCVNELVFCPKNSSYLFVNDYSGKVMKLI